MSILFDYSSHILILPIPFDFLSGGFKSRFQPGSNSHGQSHRKTENEHKKRGLPAAQNR